MPLLYMSSCCANSYIYFYHCFVCLYGPLLNYHLILIFSIVLRLRFADSMFLSDHFFTVRDCFRRIPVILSEYGDALT